MVKKIIIFILLALVVAVIVLALMFYVSNLPKVYSESSLASSVGKTRIELFNEINRYLNAYWSSRLPHNAKHLYYGTQNTPFADYTYVAFCLDSEEQCKEYLEKMGLRFGDLGEAVIGFYFNKSNVASEEKWIQEDYGPHTWSKRYQDINWPLLQEQEIYYWKGAYGSYVIYAPKNHRIYWHRDPSP